MKRSLTASLAALALLLAVGANAQAITPPNQIQWTYNFSPVVPGTLSSLPAVYADSNTSAGITFTNEPTKFAVGVSNIVGTNIRVFSTAAATAPDTLTGTNGNYGLALTLTDVASAAFTTLTFNGTLTGTFSADNSDIDHTAGPNAFQTVDLGNTRYTIQLGNFTPPGPPSASNAGAIQFRVTVQDIERVPEPSTILLSGLGLTFLGGAAWRKRRQARAAK